MICRDYEKANNNALLLVIAVYCVVLICWALLINCVQKQRCDWGGEALHKNFCKYP